MEKSMKRQKISYIGDGSGICITSVEGNLVNTTKFNIDPAIRASNFTSRNCSQRYPEIYTKMLKAGLFTIVKNWTQMSINRELLKSIRSMYTQEY